MPILTALVVNGTYIVPADAPTVLTPEQFDILSVGAVVIGFLPFIGGIAALLSGRKAGELVSFGQLSFLWLWSITLVGFGIFASFGRFGHLVDTLAILHIQSEWLIIAFLLKVSPPRSVLLSSFGGLVLYSLMFGLPGIQGTFLVTSIIGGWGDILIPVLLINQKSYLLAFGGIAHFVNAYVTFHSFVQYTDISLYLVFQLVTAGAHAIFIVAGILFASDAGSGPIALDRELNREFDSVKTARQGVVRLVIISLVLSLLASIPINFWPRN